MSEMVKAGMIIACWLVEPDKVSFADVVYAHEGKESIWVRYLDNAGNGKLQQIKLGQVIAVVANRRKTDHD